MLPWRRHSGNCHCFAFLEIYNLYDPKLVLHFSYPSLFRIYTNLTLLWPNQFNISGTLLLSCILWLLVKKMFNFYFKVAQYLIFVCCFPVKCCCFSDGPPDLGTACSGLALLTEVASLLVIMAALVALITVCAIACVMLCSAAIFYFSFLDTSLFESDCIVYFIVCLVWSSLPFTSDAM